MQPKAAGPVLPAPGWSPPKAPYLDSWNQASGKNRLQAELKLHRGSKGSKSQVSRPREARDQQAPAHLRRTGWDVHLRTEGLPEGTSLGGVRVREAAPRLEGLVFSREAEAESVREKMASWGLQGENQHTEFPRLHLWT